MSHESCENGASRRSTVFRHPFEIAVCGSDAAALNAFVQTLMDSALQDYTVARVLASQANPFDLSQDQLAADVVIVKSSTEVDAPKIVLGDWNAMSDSSSVVARVGGASNNFAPTDAIALRGILRKHLEERARAVPLYGLVLAGGKSTRMGRDKAALDVAGKPQALRVAELLAMRCKRVFVSARPGQNLPPSVEAFDRIDDRFLDIGPMGGILSAQFAHPGAAWLVAACDLPFLDDCTLEHLLSARNPFKFATGFISKHDGLPEPLFTVYEPKSRLRLMHFLALGIWCPRKVLLNSDVKLIEQPRPGALENVNRPVEYQEALARFAQHRQSVS